MTYEPTSKSKTLVGWSLIVQSIQRFTKWLFLEPPMKANREMMLLKLKAMFGRFHMNEEEQQLLEQASQREVWGLEQLNGIEHASIVWRGHWRIQQEHSMQFERSSSILRGKERVGGYKICYMMTPPSFMTMPPKKIVNVVAFVSTSKTSPHEGCC